MATGVAGDRRQNPLFFVIPDRVGTQSRFLGSFIDTHMVLRCTIANGLEQLQVNDLYRFQFI